MSKLKVAVVGAGGRMGKCILSLLASDQSVEIVGALEQKYNSVAGKKLNSIISGYDSSLKIEHDLIKALSKADGIIDFSSPASSIETALYASARNLPLVIGTTGLSKSQKNKINKLCRNFPCVLSPNMSIGVNIMFEISQILTKLMHKDFDIEILETHHRNKKDSPSGTALRLAELVAESMESNLGDIAVYSRHGNTGPRKKGELGIQTLRGGDIVGEHSLFFYGDGEHLVLTHKASSRNTFAKGAIKALKWLADKPNGLYSMKDVLGF